MVPFLWILRHGFTVQELCNINKFNKKYTHELWNVVFIVHLARALGTVNQLGASLGEGGAGLVSRMCCMCPKLWSDLPAERGVICLGKALMTWAFVLVIRNFVTLNQGVCPLEAYTLLNGTAFFNFRI